MQDSLRLKSNLPRRIIPVCDWKIIHYSQAALSGKQAYGTLHVPEGNLSKGYTEQTRRCLPFNASYASTGSGTWCTAVHACFVTLCAQLCNFPNCLLL